MGLDGAFLRAVVLEIKDFVGAKIYKISQLSSYELVFVLKKSKQTKNLIVSISPSNPCVYFKKEVKKGIDEKKYVFETLIRSRLRSSWLFDVVQDGLDRVLKLHFKAKTEIGDEKDYIVYVEFFSRYSNIILYDLKTLKIEDSFKRVSLDSFIDRPVLPKLKMTFLEKQNKINILKTDSLEVVQKILEQKESILKEAILKTLEGFSGFVADVVSFSFKDILVKDFSSQQKAYLYEIISFLKKTLEGNFEFVAIFLDGKLKDFTFFDVTKFSNLYNIKKFESVGSLLDFYYEEKAFLERETKKRNGIFRFLKQEISKTQNKIKAREEDFKNATLKKDYKKYGDLLAANVYKLKKGQGEIVVEDYYDCGKPIKIKLNPKFSPSENIKFYYKSYKKANLTKENLKTLLEEAKKDLEFLQNEYQFVKRCTNEEDLLNIIEELNEENFKFDVNIKRNVNKKKDEKEDLFLKFRTSDGFLFFCGKNSKANDVLTLKKAKKDDYWFHISDLSGSHVVVFTNGKEITDTAILEAATVSAYYSSAHDEKKADVWYTKVLNVSKQKGAKPGMVNFKEVKTITVNLDFELVEKLRIK